MDIKKLKEIITAQQILTLLHGFGVEGRPTMDDRALMFPSICHQSESLKLYFYLDSKQFYCYSHCHSMDIITLVTKVLNCDTNTAYKFIINKLGIEVGGYREGFDDEEMLLTDDWDIIKQYKTTIKESKEPNVTIRDVDMLNRFYNLYHTSFIEDGISKFTMYKFGIKFDIEHNRIIIPHYDEFGNLIAVRARNLEQSQLDLGRKYMPIVYNNKVISAPSSQYFYGLNFNIENIKKAKRIIIFESEKSVMQMETMFPGFNISVALSGSALSNKHLEILRNLGVEEVILALDKEFEEINTVQEKLYQTKIKKRIIDKLRPYFNISLLWDKEGLLEYKDSPSDKGKEVFLKLFDNRWFI